MRRKCGRGTALITVSTDRLRCHSSDMSQHGPSFEWQDIETVLVDMDGTLLDLAFDNYFWRRLVPADFARLNDMSTE